MDRHRYIAGFGVFRIQTPDTFHRNRLRGQHQWRQLLRLDHIVNVLVERDKPGDLGLIGRKEPVQVVVDVRMHLHRAVSVVCGGLGWIAVQNFRHFGRSILSEESS